MRLMLGGDMASNLLVAASCKEVTDKFKFWVINGNWDGIFDNGTVTVISEGFEIHTITGMKILCSDQMLLKGNDYSKIMNKFDKIQQLENKQWQN